MTRLTQRSLALVVCGAALFVGGCSGSSSSNKDATAATHDGSSVPTDGTTTQIDSSPDVSPITPTDGPVVPPDTAVDTASFAADSAIADRATSAGDATGTDGTARDGAGAAVDNPVATLDAGPIATADAASDGAAAADDGAPVDDAGTGTDLLPIGCNSFTGGSVTADLTLTRACSPYTITDSIFVDGNAALTIEAGVTLRFAADAALYVGDTDSGRLVAVGTAQNPTTFTSAALAPTPGDWSSIVFLDSAMAGNQIAYAKLDYCGADRNACIVGDGVHPNRVTLDHLTIDHVGPGSDGILEYDEDSNFVIANSTFSRIPTAPLQQYAISVMALSFAGIGAGNTFNGGSMIEIQGGTIASTTSWVDPGTTIAVTDDLVVDGANSPVLTLGPGMTFKFGPDRSFDIGWAATGKLVVAGTAAKQVTLTSLLAVPNPGAWAGVNVWDDSSAQLSYADIAYGGGAGQGGGDLTLENGNSTSRLVVDHSSFTYSLGYAIYLPCPDVPVATVTLDPSNSYAHNAADTTNANDQAHNVGPGLSCHH